MGCKLEEAVNWAIELLISGHINKFWEKVLTIGIKNININNPCMGFFLYNKYSKHIDLVGKSNVLSVRNNQRYRNLVAETCFIICNSLKTKSLGFSKIKDSDFNMHYLETKILANSPNLINDKLKYGDPNETKIILNEFNYCLINRKYELCVYWLSWILEWEKIHVKKYKQFKVAARYNDGIDKKCVTNVIWLIWEIVNYVKKTNFDIQLECHQELNSLWDLYRRNFTLGSRSRKLIYLIWSIKFLVTPKCDWKLKLVERPYLYFHSLANVNLMARKIKPHEVNKGIYQNDKYKILIQDNYIVSGNEKTSKDNARIRQEEKHRKDMEKAHISRMKEAKKKKVSMNSMNKMDTLREIDKYMNF